MNIPLERISYDDLLKLSIEQNTQLFVKDKEIEKLQKRLDDIIYYANKRIEEDIDDTERVILQSIILIANGTIKVVRENK